MMIEIPEFSRLGIVRSSVKRIKEGGTMHVKIIQIQNVSEGHLWLTIRRIRVK